MVTILAGKKNYGKFTSLCSRCLEVGEGYSFAFSSLVLSPYIGHEYFLAVAPEISLPQLACFSC